MSVACAFDSANLLVLVSPVEELLESRALLESEPVVPAPRGAASCVRPLLRTFMYGERCPVEAKVATEAVVFGARSELARRLAGKLPLRRLAAEACVLRHALSLICSAPTCPTAPPLHRRAR